MRGSYRTELRDAGRNRAQTDHLPLAVERFYQKERIFLLSCLDDKRTLDLEELPELQSAYHVGYMQLIQRVAERPDAARQRMVGIRLPNPKQVDAHAQLSQKKMQQRRYGTIHIHFISLISN